MVSFYTCIWADSSSAQSKVWVCGRSLAGILGSNPAGVVCCQVEVSASGWSLVQKSPTECGVSECDHESSTMRTPWPTGGISVIVKNVSEFCILAPWRRPHTWSKLVVHFVYVPIALYLCAFLCTSTVCRSTCCILPNRLVDRDLGIEFRQWYIPSAPV